MSDFTTTYRWTQEDIDWCNTGSAEENDRALELWLNAPPSTYTPTLLLDDGTTPAWFTPGVGYWTRQRAQFIICSYSIPVTSLPPSTGKFVGVSMPTAAAAVSPPAGGAWWFPIGGTSQCVSSGGALAFGRTRSFAIVSGVTYFLNSGLTETAVRVQGSGSTIMGVGMYRESV